ncbi:MAG TPA: tRNA (5-methylaminomethyl-2-thiouridine)(34)-methyltransferase MnmD [Mucilaginibacter sp.]|nr:tRNA (5-methylaminomethyl-2-thiouridine)(34)-methyltransferase MnmD [Mucilaginibacter sp.]
MNPQLLIVQTADGSNTIYSTDVGEHYHSTNGALQESRHVFLNSGLIYFLEKDMPKVSPYGGDRIAIGLEGAVSILEVGFGTGLNFLLSAEYCMSNGIRLDYTGIESFPLNKEFVMQTGYDQYIAQPVWDSFIHQYPDAINQRVNISPSCQLMVSHDELLSFRSNQLVDIVYFDAFASARQPEMWSEEAITHAASFLKSGGVFVTYAITGNLKRNMKDLGFSVEKAPGAPGKREMLRAIRHADMRI